MKKFFLLTAVLLQTIYIQAQGILPAEVLQQMQLQNYVPFHQYLQQHAADFQRNNHTRGIIYKKIAYRHDLYPASSFVTHDTGSYNYTPEAWLTDADSLSVGNTSTLKNYAKSVFTYDANGNQLTNTHQNWDTTAHTFVNSSRTIKTFNAVNLVLTSTNQSWNSSGGGSWVNVNHVTNYWDSNDLFTGSLTEVWSSGAWVNSSKTNGIVHDANKNLLQEVVQSWVSGAWVNAARYFLTWNSNSKLTVFASQTWKASSSSWINFSQTNYTRDANDLETQYLTTRWDTLTSQWDSLYRFSFTYNAGGKATVTIAEQWGASSFVNWYKFLDSYDGNNNWTSHEYLFWSSGAWTEAYKDNYTYDGNNNAVYELNLQWSNSTNDYTINVGRYYFYYQSFNVAGVDEIKNELKATLYPNPTDGDIYLEMNTKGNAAITVTIYDVNGRMLSTEKLPAVNGPTNLSLGMKGMASGNYFVQVADNNYGKMSVMKVVKK